MDKKSVILVVVLVVGMIFSIFLSHKRAFVDRDFTIVDEEAESP